MKEEDLKRECFITERHLMFKKLKKKKNIYIYI